MIERTSAKVLYERIQANWPEAASAETAVVVSIVRLNDLIRFHAETSLKPLGLSYAAFEVLFALRAQPQPREMTPTELNHTALLSSGGTSNVLKHLEQQGYLERLHNPQDKRSKIVRLTQDGSNVVERAMASVMKQDQVLFSEHSKGSDWEQIKDLLLSSISELSKTQKLADSRRPKPVVTSVQINEKHGFSKQPQDEIELIENFGVRGDAHAGETDQHRYHIKRYGKQPNLRQVHIIQSEFFDEVSAYGHAVKAGELGENITTQNLDLLSLPTGTKLRFGDDAIVELTGLRNPCPQIEEFQAGLLAHCKVSTDDGVKRKVGVMGVVQCGGFVKEEDNITVDLPPEPHVPLRYRVPGK